MEVEIEKTQSSQNYFACKSNQDVGGRRSKDRYLKPRNVTGAKALQQQTKEHGQVHQW
jgi:hypothetical protein